MKLVRWGPLQQIVAMSNRLNRTLNDSYTDPYTRRTEDSFGAWAPPVDIFETVDAEKVTATYKNGVLEVIVPKVETAKPKRIEIKAA